MPYPIPPTDTSTATHSPVTNSQEPTPRPLLSNWQPLFDDLEIDANPHLTESQKAELKNLVIEYSDTFQPSTAGLQQTDYVYRRIDTGNAKPSNSPPYRVSPTKRQIFSEQIDSVLHDDIISPSERKTRWKASFHQPPSTSLPSRVDHYLEGSNTAKNSTY